VETTCAIHAVTTSTGLCNHCGNFGCDDCLGYLRGELICQDCVLEGRVAVYPPTPWEQRSDLGIARALWGTVWAVTSRPAPFFREMNPDGSVGEALGVAALASACGALVLGGISGFAVGSIGLLEGGEGALVALGIGGAMIAMMLIMVPIGVVIGALLMGLIHHGLLRLMGGGGKGLNATLRAQAYAWTLQFWLVTVCGYYFISFWVSIVSVFAYAAVHGDSHLKTAGAVIGPVFICGGAYAVLFGALALSGNL